MSKIGRKPIPFSSAKVEVSGKNISIKGGKFTLTHELCDGVNANVEGNELLLSVDKETRINRMNWGLHRSLLANMIKGVETGFEQKVKIVGLGYKAQISGQKMVLSLGYSHKVNYVVPEGVAVTADKSGQNLVFKSHDKALLGQVCDDVRHFKMPEPYKGTGIIREGDTIVRKAGKTGA